MGLEEQFENVEIMFECQIGTLKYDELCEAPKLCVEIAENFAIGFVSWLEKNKKETKKIIIIEELLEIYKKTL